jgi:hypothetical protein
MTDGFEQAPLKDLAARTGQIVSWLKLNNVPTAAQVDSTGKLGLQGAFRMHDGVYFDPIPAGVIQKAKEDVNAVQEHKTIDIPLLQESRIGGEVIKPKPKITTHGGHVTIIKSAGPEVLLNTTLIPIFKEQVQAVAQFLSHLGFEPPQPNATRGETFVLVDDHPSNVHYYSTADPDIGVEITRNGPNDTDQATKVELIIHQKKK